MCLHLGHSLPASYICLPHFVLAERTMHKGCRRSQRGKKKHSVNNAWVLKGKILQLERVNVSTFLQ